MHETLLAMQHADSFFPSGAVSFSYGLETLHADGQVSDAADVERFLIQQLQQRWATLDWGIVAAAHAAHADLVACAALDELAHASTLAEELRSGSMSAGQALLGVHARLGTSGAAEYMQQVLDERARGHLAVVQGMVWRACGLSLQHAALVGGHSFAVAVAAAALRLGILGHLDAQRIIKAAQPAIIAVAEAPAPSTDTLHAYTPLAEIAVMRHAHQNVRLFSN